MVGRSRVKVGFFGDGPWAHGALKRLVADVSVEVKFVCVRFGRPDQVLAALASGFGIPVLSHRDVNSDAFFDMARSYGADLFVSMSFDQIFKGRMINHPPLKAINCHAGKLPFYRGRNVLNWALINDEPEFGITVHYMDEGIDTGDIILQKTYPITDRDDYRSLLATAYEGCAGLLYDAVKLIQAGQARPVWQGSIDPVGMYCGVRREGDEAINWDSTSREVFNFIRALCRPGPMAASRLNGQEVRVNKARLVPGARAYINIPGQVLGRTGKGFYVKTRDTFIEVVEYEYKGKVKVGDRLGWAGR